LFANRPWLSEFPVNLVQPSDGMCRDQNRISVLTVPLMGQEVADSAEVIEVGGLLVPVGVESPIPLDQITQGSSITGWQPEPSSEGLLDVSECVEKLIVQVRVRSAGAHERTPDGRVRGGTRGRDTRAGHYSRHLHTKAGEVELKVPKLRSLPFESAVIERYRRRESSVEEALVEMYLAGVSRATATVRPRTFSTADKEMLRDAATVTLRLAVVRLAGRFVAVLRMMCSCVAGVPTDWCRPDECVNGTRRLYPVGLAYATGFDGNPSCAVQVW
jgi:Transposase, Mutator family